MKAENRPTPDCIPVDELAQVLERGSDDPRRAHLATCPRCRALGREFQSFLADVDPLPGQNDPAAAAHLREVLKAEILGPGSRKIVTLAPWWRRPQALAFAAAATVLVVFGAVQIARRPPEGETLLRGSDWGDAFQGLPSATLTAEGAETVVRFRWEPQEGAFRYSVELYGPTLDRIGTLEAGSETSLRWLPSGTAVAADVETVLWRVVVSQDEDARFRSELQSLRLR